MKTSEKIRGRCASGTAIDQLLALLRLVGSGEIESPLGGFREKLSDLTTESLTEMHDEGCALLTLRGIWSDAVLAEVSSRMLAIEGEIKRRAEAAMSEKDKAERLEYERLKAKFGERG